MRDVIQRHSVNDVTSDASKFTLFCDRLCYGDVTFLPRALIHVHDELLSSLKLGFGDSAVQAGEP